MIVDITNELLSKLKIKLVGTDVLSSYQSTLAKFPTVIFEEMDNSAYIGSKDSSGFNHSNIAFSVEIYTNGQKRMSDAKQIRGQIDEILSGNYGLARGTPVVVPNYLDDSIYRYRIVYTGIIDKNKVIYGR